MLPKQWNGLVFPKAEKAIYLFSRLFPLKISYNDVFDIFLLLFLFYTDQIYHKILQIKLNTNYFTTLDLMPKMKVKDTFLTIDLVKFLKSEDNAFISQ